MALSLGRKGLCPTGPVGGSGEHPEYPLMFVPAGSGCSGLAAKGSACGSSPAGRRAGCRRSPRMRHRHPRGVRVTSQLPESVSSVDAAGVPAPFATLGLTFDDVLLLPGATDV